MSSDTTTNEILGFNVLTGALIVLSVVLGLAFLAGTSPDMGQKAQRVTAPAAHVAAVADTANTL